MSKLLKDLETWTTFSMFKMKHTDLIFISFCCKDKAGNCNALQIF